jgi:DNA-binding FrmR family transcriptional regulator
MMEPESHTLAYLRRIDEKLDRIEGQMNGVESRLDQIADELLVLNGIVLRLEGREIETTGLKAMLDRHERWLGDRGRRVAELEGAPKD